MDEVAESTLRVSSSYAGFDELWNGFLAGVGPAGAYCVSLPENDRRRLRTALFRRLGEPLGSFALGAVARAPQWLARPRSRRRQALHEVNGRGTFGDGIVELKGIEPLTSSLRTTRSTN